MLTNDCVPPKCRHDCVSSKCRNDCVPPNVEMTAHSEDMVIGLEIFHSRLFLCQSVLNTLVMHMNTNRTVFEALHVDSTND